ncbi:uncharacterized protein [Sylvia atricapilla]|uniref:uncharacterized protein n=1 Tax=Sylvia atricapilla TaxID=48155 RepID=UPI003392FCDB
MTSPRRLRHWRRVTCERRAERHRREVTDAFREVTGSGGPRPIPRHGGEGGVRLLKGCAVRGFDLIPRFPEESGRSRGMREACPGPAALGGGISAGSGMGRGRETPGGGTGTRRESSGWAPGELRRIPQLREPRAGSGRRPGRLSGRMFPPPGCRRAFPRERGPWRDGPWPCPPPEDTWHEPPRHEPPWHEPPRHEPPWHEPPWHEPPWEHQDRGHWHRRHSPRHFPEDVPWKEEEDRRWAPHDCPPRPPWDDREDFQGFGNGFEECWYLDPPPDPWPEFPEEEQPPACPPAGPPRNPGAFRAHSPPWSHGPPGRRRPHRSHHHRHLTLVPQAWGPQSPRGHEPHSKRSPVPSKRSQRVARKEPQPPDPPRPPAPLQGAEQSPEQPQDVPAQGGNVLEPPGPAGSPLESSAAAPGAAEAPVELEAGQSAVGSQEQDPCALGTDPAPPEQTSSYPDIQELREVEPCSADVTKAGSGRGSHPPSPAAPPDPAKGELLESSSSGEAGAELSPRSWEQPPCGAGEAEAEAAQGGPLQSPEPPENPQVPPGAAAEAEAQPSQASAGATTTPEMSPGSGDTDPAVCGQPQLCSTLPTPFPAGFDFRSAAVLAKKAEIELSYQQFSLTFAVVATMLLQKEPSMEAALGLALRANLRQRRIHHLQQLEDFIDSYDLAAASL